MFALAFVIVLAGDSENTAVAQLVKSVETVAVTVSDVDRSTEFFNKVLSFEKIGDVEVHGEPYEKLKGLFGVRMRVVRRPSFLPEDEHELRERTERATGGGLRVLVEFADDIEATRAGKHKFVVQNLPLRLGDA